MKIVVIVMPAPQVVHPESEAIKKALSGEYLKSGVQAFKIGRRYEFDLPHDADLEKAKKVVDKLADKQLCNVSTEVYSLSVE